jgi:hypothetical protein
MAHGRLTRDSPSGWYAHQMEQHPTTDSDVTVAARGLTGGGSLVG